MPLLASRFAILTWTNLTLLVFPFHGIHYLDLTPDLVLSILVLFSISKDFFVPHSPTLLPSSIQLFVLFSFHASRRVEADGIEQGF